jgi:hypothetical protein
VTGASRVAFDADQSDVTCPMRGSTQLTLALEFRGNSHQVSMRDKEKTMSHPSDQRGADAVPSDRVQQGPTGRNARRGVALVLLGAAIVLGLGYVLLSAGPSPASVTWPDRGPDQSTGPTDPNGPQR